MEVRSFEAIIRVLNEASIRYLVVGGIAVNAYGYERLTVDIDLVINLEEKNIIRGLKALESIGYRMTLPVTPEEFAKKENREKWRKEKNMLVLKLWSDEHRRTPVDVFVFEPFNFSAEFENIYRMDFGNGLLVPIVPYETLISMKEDAGREKDMLDIQYLRKLDPYR